MVIEGKNIEVEMQPLLFVRYKSEAKKITKFLNDNNIFALVPKENTQNQVINHRTVMVLEFEHEKAAKLSKKFAKKHSIELLEVFDKNEAKNFINDGEFSL